MTKFKQYRTVVFISILFSFLILSISALSNFFENKEKMVSFLGFDASDIQLADSDLMAKTDDLKLIIHDIEANYEVAEVIGFQSQKSNLNTHTTTALIYDKFTEQNINLVEGNSPRNDNEITITPTLQKTLALNIGDNVSIKGKDNEIFEFVISGIHQSIEDMGNNFKISSDGYRRIQNDFNPMMAKLYLKGGTEKAKKSLIEKYKDFKPNIVVADGSESYIDTVNTVQLGLLAGTMLMLIVSIFMIMLATLLIATVTVVREKSDNGIMKALGYTTSQLKLQLCYRFLLTSLLGTIIGTILAVLFANGLFTALFQNLGISKVTLIWNPLLVISVCLFISVSSTLVSLLVSKRIKRINPKDLVIE